jgi:hypothetical protein
MPYPLTAKKARVPGEQTELPTSKADRRSKNGNSQSRECQSGAKEKPSLNERCQVRQVPANDAMRPTMI